MKPITKEAIYFFVFRLCAWAGVLVLVAVVGLLLSLGYGVLSGHFLTSAWQHRDITQGGISMAILGSLYLGVGVLCMSFPLGVATALFLSEYGRETIFQRIVQMAIRNLAGVPSVIYGLFGLAVFVHLFRLGTSLLSAILTLSALTLPWIITASFEAFKEVPQHFREASLALGATQLQTITKVVLPLALPGSLTGGIIGLSRAMGETAPIIVVGATFYMSRAPSGLLDKFMALPYHTFILSTQHASPHAPAYAAGTALVLISMTFVLSLGAMVWRYYLRKNKFW